MLITSGNEKLLPDVMRGADIVVKNVRTLVPKLKKLKKDGYEIVSLELTERSRDIRSFSFKEKTVIVAGNENSGVSQEILDLSDYIVKIPVFGTPSCYNVGVATSIAIYEYMKQYK